LVSKLGGWLTIPRGTGDVFWRRAFTTNQSKAKLVEQVIAEVGRFAEEFNSNHPDEHDRLFRETFKLFERLVPLLGPVIKDCTFDEELEWRLILSN
jgi:hypothetical protein